MEVCFRAMVWAMSLCSQNIISPTVHRFFPPLQVFVFLVSFPCKHPTEGHQGLLQRHTSKQVHTRTHAHTHTHTHTQTHPNALTHTHTNACTHTHTHTHTHKQTHTHTHTHTDTRARTHTHTNTPVYTCQCHTQKAHSVSTTHKTSATQYNSH